MLRIEYKGTCWYILDGQAQLHWYLLSYGEHN